MAKKVHPVRIYVYRVILSKDGTTEPFATHFGVATSVQKAIDGAIAKYPGVPLHGSQVTLLGEKAFG